MRQIIIPILLFLIVTGCSSNNGNPLTPLTSIDNSIPIISTTVYKNGGFNAIGMLGMYELQIDSMSNTAQLVSKRTSAIGESYIVSGISFFTILPCANCLSVNGISLTSEGYINLSFSISHPFEPGSILLPASAKNRLDLDIFDLALVIFPVNASATQYEQTDAGIYNGFCVAPDGYTMELEQVVNDSAALPYYLVIDDSIAGTGTWNKFEMGKKDVGFNAIFDTSSGVSGVLAFDLYLTMGYGASADFVSRLVPKYFNPEFNRKAAWKVSVAPPINDWRSDNNTELHDVIVKVYDWQINANVNPQLGFNTDIYAASEVSSVSVEIPGMTNTLPTVYTPDSGSGMPDDPLVFTVSIANENLLSEGDYFGLVKVTDERDVMEPPPVSDRDFLIDKPNATLPLVYYAMPEYATYQTFTASVVMDNPPPLEGWLCLQHDSQHTGVANCVLDPATLELKWVFPTGDEINTSPVISGGTVYFGSYDGNVYAVNLFSGNEIWHESLDSAVCGTAAIGHNAIYIGTEGGFFYALSRSSGVEYWHYQFTDTGISGETGLHVNGAMLFDDRVYFTANNANVYGLDAIDGSELFVSPTPLPASGHTQHSTPAYYEDEDQILVTAEYDEIISFNAFNGEELWRVGVSDWIVCSPTVADGMVYFADFKYVRKFDIAAPNPPVTQWISELLDPDPFGVSSSGALDDQHYYSLSLSPGKVRAHNRDSGIVEWKAPSDSISGFLACPAVSGNTIYCIDNAGIIYGFDTATGTEVFHYDLGTTASGAGSGIAIHDGRLLVGCNDGSMYCFGPS